MFKVTEDTKTIKVLAEKLQDRTDILVLGTEGLTVWSVKVVGDFVRVHLVVGMDVTFRVGQIVTIYA